MSDGPLYMLDTDVASYAMRHRLKSLDQRLQALDTTQYCISVVTRAELKLRIERVPITHPSPTLVEDFLQLTRTRDWDWRAADAFARSYERLRRHGALIADRDLMIAAHAISLGTILVTNNTRHFSRLAPELTIENWIKSAD